MSFDLSPIDIVNDISKEDFEKNYLNTRKPLIIKNMSGTWPAYEKWTLDYMKTIVGDQTVPLYDSSKADPSKPINASAAEMKFADYIDLIKTTLLICGYFFLTRLSMHLNCLKIILHLKSWWAAFWTATPVCFFGGKGSVTFIITISISPYISHPF